MVERDVEQTLTPSKPLSTAPSYTENCFDIKIELSLFYTVIIKLQKLFGPLYFYKKS